MFRYLLLAAALPSVVSSPSAPKPTALPYDLSVDLPYTSVTFVSWISAETTWKTVFSPYHCRWCDPPAFDTRVRDSLKWSDPTTANTLGSITAFAGAPLSAFGGLAAAAAYDKAPASAMAVDSMIVLETVSTTMLLTNLAKWSVARERPKVHFHSGDWESHSADDRNLSFFSGHSSLAFSFAVSSGTVASMRGYRLAPWIWLSGLSLAAFSAYSRIAADAHYMSDVVVGSCVGIGMGAAIPYFFHRPERRLPVAVSIMPLGQGSGLSLFGTF